MVENGSLKSKVDEKGALCQQLKHKIAENVTTYINLIL